MIGGLRQTGGKTLGPRQAGLLPLAGRPAAHPLRRAGNTLHAALDPHSAVPLIGASGGIAGLITFFGLAFPRAKLGFVIGFRFWIKIPALAFVLFWILLQVLGARAQIAGFGDVSYLGHLGGVAVGLVFWLAWKFGGEDRPERSGLAA